MMSQHSHFLAGLLLVVSFPAAMVALIFFKIMCLAAYRNASSTFSLVFAEVSNMNAKSLSRINFSARSTVTARLHGKRLTRTHGPFARQLRRKQLLESSSRWPPCTSVRVLRRRGGWVKAEVPGYAVDEEDSCRAAIEGLDDGSEAFLASSVPDLHLDTALLVELDLLGVELHSQRGRVPLAELILGEAVEQAALPHAGRPNYDHFKCLLVLLLHRGYTMNYLMICTPTISEYPTNHPATTP